MLVKPIEAPAVCSRDALLQGFEGELLQQGYRKVAGPHARPSRTLAFSGVPQNSKGIPASSPAARSHWARDAAPRTRRPGRRVGRNVAAPCASVGPPGTDLPI